MTQSTLPEGTLVAYLDNHATEAEIAQIERDGTLLDAAAFLAVTENALYLAYSRTDCPSVGQLLEFEYRFLPSEQVTALEQHLALCSLCRRDLRTLQQISLEDSPPVLPAWLAQLLANGKQRLDMLLQPQVKSALALRGESDTSVLFATDPYRIFLSKQCRVTTEDIWQIDGQLFEAEMPLFEQSGTVLLVQASQPVQQISLDRFGTFQFDDVPAGEYTIAIELNEAVLLATPYTV